MSGIMCAMPNVSAPTNSFTVTVDTLIVGVSIYSGYRGTSPTLGSVSPSPAKVTVFANAVMNDIYYLYDSFSAFDEVALVVQGDQTSTAWTSVTIAGNTYTKASVSSATYDSGNNVTTFEWYSPGSNPFGTSGTVSVVFA